MTKTVMKTEIVKEIAKATGVSQDVTKAVVNAFIDAVKAHVQAGTNVTIKDFGRFEKRHRAAKDIVALGGNRETIPAHDILGFKTAVRF